MGTYTGYYTEWSAHTHGGYQSLTTVSSGPRGGVDITQGMKTITFADRADVKNLMRSLQEILDSDVNLPA